jgi:beta-xylosidase
MFPLLSRRGLVAFALTLSAVSCVDEPITTSALDPTDPTGVEAGQTDGSGPYQNPVYPGDFADPFVLRVASSYYGYATNSHGLNVPTLRSDDLLHWTPTGDALPLLPGWAQRGRHLTWAPSVLALEDRYILFFTTRDLQSGRQCTGRAEGSSPIGPFADRDSVPFLCQTDLGGSIDASVVRDSTGGLYLIWKNDGNCCGKPVSLWSQRLSEDAQHLLGTPAELLQTDQPWEGPLIEGPTMWWEAGGWHLLYSANQWNTGQYAIGYAACASPLGPCRKTQSVPLMASNGSMAGPGGAEVFADVQGRHWLAYHAWTAGRVGYAAGGVRSLRITTLDAAVSPIAGVRFVEERSLPATPIRPVGLRQDSGLLW